MRRPTKASSAGSTSGIGSSRGLFGRAFATRGASSGADGSGAPQARRLALPLTVFTVILTLVLGASQALASKGVVNFVGGSTTGTTGGLFNTPRGVAVYQTTSDVYVVDGNNNRIQRLSSSGAFVSAWGRDVIQSGKPGDLGDTLEVCTVAADCKAGSTGTAADGPGGELAAPQGIAIDQVTGNVYVTERTNRRVSEFDPTGNFVRAFGWDVTTGGVTTYEICAVAANCKQGASGAGAGQFAATIGYPATDGSGNLYVANQTNRRVDKFDLTGNFVSAYGWGVDTNANGFETCTTASTCNAGSTVAPGDNPGQFASGSPTHITTDASGNVYAVDAGNNRVQKFNSAGTPLASAFASAQLSGSPAPTALATDASTNRVLAAKSNGTEVNVLELDTGGTLRDTHMSGAGIVDASGLAENTASGAIYVSSTTGGPRIYILGTQVPPTVTIEPVTTFAGTTATFEGKVNPTGFETGYHFEYVDDADFQVFGYANATKAPISDASVGSGIAEVPVSQNVTELIGSTLYHVRLVATKRFLLGTAIAASATSTEITFTTDPAAPAISGTASSGVTETEAILRAQVNPANQATTYHFEYGNQGPCVANPCMSTAEASAGSGAGAVSLSQPITGLAASTTYHFWLVATNPTGATAGPDTTFTTYPAQTVDTSCPNQAFRTGPSANLPDCRAYELVDPANKNNVGGQYGPYPFPDGNHVYWGTGMPLDGAQSGDFQNFLSTRTDSGWVNTALHTPQAAGEPEGAGSLDSGQNIFFASFTSDFSTAFLNSPFDLSPMDQDKGMDVYRFSLADSSSALAALPETGPLTQGLMSPPGAYTGFLPGTYLAGNSADGSRVFFETTVQLPTESGTTADTHSSSTEIYERTGGHTILVGVLPDGSVPDCGADIGNGANSALNNQGLFNFDAVAPDGSNLVFHSPGFQAGTCADSYPDAGAMYLWKSTGPSVPLSGLFFGGRSADGSKIFTLGSPHVFGQDDRSTGEIYEYDIPTGQTTTIGVGNLLSFSANGSRVYYEAPHNGGTYLYANGTSTLIPGTAAGGYAGSAIKNYELTQTSVDMANMPATTPGGSKFVFLDTTNLTSYDSGGYAEAYLYDASTNQVSCVSCDPSGAPPHGEAQFIAESVPGQNSFTSPWPNSISGDGSMIFFETPEALVSQDTNGQTDVYEWHDGQVSLISSGAGSVAAQFVGASGDGQDVYFRTSTQLTAEPMDSSVHIYDARVNGGFPTPPATLPCSVESCKPPPAPAPSGTTPGSSAFYGPGNPNESTRCTISGIQKLSSSDRSNLAKGGKARLRLKVNCSGTVTLAGTAKVGKKNRRVVRSSAKARKAGAVSIPFALSKSARTQLRSKRSLTVRLVVRFKDARPKVVRFTLKSATSKKGGRS